MQIGPYQVQRELARGGMGVVYHARGAEGEEVALKLLLEGIFSSPAQQRRFRREATSLESLDHPGILRVRAHGVADGRPYLATDLLPGPTLADVVKTSGPLPEARAVELARAICEALAHAHARGIVHRDLKPANVLLRGDAPVLVDFGLVRQLGLEVSRLTETGAVMGSPEFMAPEQALGEGDVGPAADLYALGATLYFLLTGRPPFEGKSVLAILERVVNDEVPPPSQLRPGLNPRLEATVLRCLEKEPGRRFPTAFALEQALAEASDPVSPARPPATRRALAWIALGACLVAAVGLLGWFVWRDGAAPSGSSGARDERELAAAGERTVPAEGAEAAGLVERGNAQALEGRYEEAVGTFSQALTLDPDNALARYGLGFSRANQGRYEEALVDYERAIQLDPYHALSWRDLALCQTKLRRYEKAIQAYDRACELDPRDALAHANRARCKASLQRFTQAIEDFTRALELDSRDVEAWIGQGNCRLSLGDFAGATADYDRALALDPKSDKAHFNRANCRTQLGLHAEALEDLDRVLELRVGDAATYALRAQCWTNLDRYAQALADYDQALQLDPNNASVLTNRGMVKHTLGRYHEAIEDFDRSIALEPREPVVHLNRAQSKVELGRSREASGDYDRALELGLRDALTYVARGLNREELGRDAEAIEDYDAALKLGLPALEAEDLRQRRAELARRLEEAHLAPAKRADVYFNQGLSAAHAGRLQEAIDHAEESLAQELSARALILRGDCRWKLKQVDAAIADFSEALRLEPRNVLALRQRALSLMSLGRGPEAIADFDRLLELDPGNVDAYVNRAVVKFRLGRIGEASLDYERALRLSPQSWDVLLGLASCKANLGRDAEAIEDYDRALALEPRYAPGYKERGLSKAKLGRHAEAIEDFDRALRLGLSEGDAEEARRLRAEANAARKAAQPEGS